MIIQMEPPSFFERVGSRSISLPIGWSVFRSSESSKSQGIFSPRPGTWQQKVWPRTYCVSTPCWCTALWDAWDSMGFFCGKKSLTGLLLKQKGIESYRGIKTRLVDSGWKTSWWFHFFYVYPYLEKWSSWTNIFSDGLKPRRWWYSSSDFGL